MSSYTRFSGELDLGPLNKKTGKRTVLKGFDFYVGSLASGIWVHVPQGFETDGASVPKCLQWVLPPFGKYGQAAVVHDKLYTDAQITVDGKNINITRARADSIFLEAMGVLKVSSLVQNAMYLAVRLFGESRFKEES
jgi:hypothetical protein